MRPSFQYPRTDRWGLKHLLLVQYSLSVQDLSVSSNGSLGVETPFSTRNPGLSSELSVSSNGSLGVETGVRAAEADQATGFQYPRTDRWGLKQVVIG